MALQFTTTSEAARVNGIKVLVYGKAGTGKTVLCSTAPSPLILAAEAGLLSLAHTEIPVIKIETMDDLYEAYNWIKTNKKASRFKTICLDSISEIAEVVLSTAKAKVKDARMAYGELIEQMMDIIKKFRDLEGKNVYFSAKEEKAVDSVSNTVTFGPSMPGTKLGPSLPYYFDEVFNLNIGLDKKGAQYRYLKTSSDFQYEAKDRSGTLDPKEPANLTAVFDKIAEKFKQKEKK